MMKVLKLFLFHLPMLATLCFFDLFFYKVPMHRKWVRLKCVSHLFLDALFCFISYSLVSIFYNLHAQLKCIKESAYWEATQNVFTFSFSGLDACYYCSNIIVSLFSSFVPSFSLRLQESSKVVTCCPETDSVCLTEKLA